jgi:hypothetical protein
VDVVVIVRDSDDAICMMVFPSLRITLLYLCLRADLLPVGKRLVCLRSSTPEDYE